MEKNSISKLEIIQTRITNDNNNKTSEEKLLLIPLITEANNSCSWFPFADIGSHAWAVHIFINLYSLTKKEKEKKKEETTTYL